MLHVHHVYQFVIVRLVISVVYFCVWKQYMLLGTAIIHDIADSAVKKVASKCMLSLHNTRRLFEGLVE